MKARVLLGIDLFFLEEYLGDLGYNKVTKNVSIHLFLCTFSINLTKIAADQVSDCSFEV